ncbi:MAG TPA: hypothetical protein VES38_06585 [Methylotenera sp.]|nr:hypothetical protein [Methylotenera sp.]
MNHKILDEFINGGWIKPTTHKRVTYDELTQEFLVELDDKNLCTIHGAHRFNWAIKVADYAESVSVSLSEPT